ncbi:MAG: hypothetical protein E7096_07030 [Bacteroides sp.]|nr:hypothetical protein [Bacteroides sp.]
MYEGIEDINRLLDAGRLKEALTQLQAIATQVPSWELQNRIEATTTAYDYLLQYAAQGMEDPSRGKFFQKTLRTAYELTDIVNIALMAQKTTGVYFDLIRTFKLHPPKAYAELQMILESFTEDIGTAPLLYHEPTRLKAETERIHQIHEQTVTELFDKTWTSALWTEAEAAEANALLGSMLVPANDLAVMVSAVTLALLRLFDARKLNFLFEAYTHEELQVNQRAIVGIVITLLKHTARLALYPEIRSRLSLLTEDEGFCNNLYTIQMQLLITRETTKIDKKMREEIIPEMIKNAKQLNDPKFHFDETEDPEDRNPEWEEWMDKSGMADKIKEMGEWQMAGADVYMSSFAQLKHYPFFRQAAHWFYPFDINLPMLAPLKKNFDQSAFSPLRLITASDFFCNSDKYSFALAILSMPQPMKEHSMQQMEEQVRMNEEHRDRLEQLMQKKKEAKGISRQYIQDLYRFFKLWSNHKEEEDIFHWNFALWENPLLAHALLRREQTNEMANYLLQKGYLEEAYTLFSILMRNEPPQAEIYQKAGYIRQKQKKYADAIHLYKHADLLATDNLWTNKHLAQCHKLKGDITTALEYYRKVETVQPENLNIALQIGQCLIRQENYAEALSYFYKVEYLEKNPDNARRAIAWCSLLTGKYKEALKYYALLTAEPSVKAEDWINTGHIYLIQGNLPEACRNYQEAHEHFDSHTAFIQAFDNDRRVLQERGLSDEEIRIVLDLLI